MGEGGAGDTVERRLACCFQDSVDTGPSHSTVSSSPPAPRFDGCWAGGIGGAVAETCASAELSWEKSSLQAHGGPSGGNAYVCERGWGMRAQGGGSRGPTRGSQQWHGTCREVGGVQAGGGWRGPTYEGARVQKENAGLTAAVDIQPAPAKAAAPWTQHVQYAKQSAATWASAR